MNTGSPEFRILSIIVVVASSVAFKRYLQVKTEEQRSEITGKVVLWCFMAVLALALVMGIVEKVR